MNIAFDGIALLSPTSKNRGIGNYVHSQLKTVLEQDRENRYFFFNAFGETDLFPEETASGRLREEDFLCVKDGAFLRAKGFREFYGELVKTFLRKNQIDVFYITSPFDGIVPAYEQSWFSETRTVAICYDIIPYLFPERYLQTEKKKKWYMECVKVLEWVDRILVISQSVKDDLIRCLGLSADKIEVIWGAPDPQFRQIPIAADEKARLLEKFAIDSPFIMCTGGNDWRKNLDGLITAYGRLPKELHRQYQLVIVCKLNKATVNLFTDLAEKLGVGGRVVLTNFVTDEELLQLYNLAALMAFPSKYEGFGLPVVEAWACGTPVLTSRNSSLGQIAGDAAVLVDPESVESVTEGLRRALQETDLEQLTKKGQERLGLFQWEHVADETVKAFEKVGAAGRTEGEAEETNCRRLIAFFTPLPPQQSGISDYSLDILWAISRYFDVDVFIDEGYEIACDLPACVHVFPHTAYESMAGRYYRTVFQMGNSEYHFYMWPYVRKHGGVLVLHDFNMHTCVRYKIFQTYREILREDFDEAKTEAFLGTLQGDTQKLFELEINGFLTKYADSIIVHSAEAKSKLLKRNIGLRVHQIYHYAKIEALPDPLEAKKALGIPENTLLLAAFGHVSGTKRELQILQAFARLARSNAKAQLVFVGKLSPALEKSFWNRVKDLGIQDRVRVTGYTEIDTFLRYIDATDICLNLRHPYVGETSGSLMRILAKGKCVIVNNIGSFGEIPDDCCVKLPRADWMAPDEEIQRIYEALKELAADREYRKTLQKNARHFAEENLALDKIAEKYRDAILEQPEESPVTNQLLSSLGELTHVFSREQKRRLAHTLAYVCETE